VSNLWQARAQYMNAEEVIAQGSAGTIKDDAEAVLVRRNLPACRLWRWEEDRQEWADTRESIRNTSWNLGEPARPG